ncbi:MAG: hypothetical protein HY654_05645 [Acidobacteria bacterium]|nr:hypothetical protein [Acidobacteriota bacterium]
MKTCDLVVGGALCLVTVVRIAAAQPEPPRKVPIVVVVGCLGQEVDDTWVVSSAANPIELGSKAPSPPSDAEAAKLTGTSRYRLIGTSEFSLPGHKGHKVRVEGLLIQAKPMNRLNITSVRHIADTCGAK